jgi:hypothetical protein
MYRAALPFVKLIIPVAIIEKITSFPKKVFLHP